MKILKLDQRYRNLNAGEVAGFPDKEADLMIKRGVGKLYKADNKGMAKPKANKMVQKAKNKQESDDDTDYEKEVDKYHTGGGWYKFPNAVTGGGEVKKRGEDAAIEFLKSLKG